MKKKLIKLIFIVILIVAVCFLAALIFLFGPSTHKKAEFAAPTTHEGMYVDGTTLRMSDGAPVVMRGINHSHCWYREDDEAAFDAIAATGANSIRIVLSNGDRWDMDDSSEVKKVIDMARERGMIAVLEVHDGTGDDDVGTLEKIADYWVGIADVLQGTEDYCIVNIANEWVGAWNSSVWKDGYIRTIPMLRDAGIKNVIMVDAAGWGQYGRSIRAAGMDVFDADPDHNTMFSVHMYGMSGRYKWLIRYNLEGARDQNLCVCVGEFGYMHEDGDVKEDYLMKYCEEQGIGTLAWSWKGNSGGVEYLDLSNDWEGKDLSIQWGEKAVNGEYGIRNTSIKVLTDMVK